MTWLPLLFLAAAEGVAWGDRVEVPLLKDFLPYGQFLLVVPALVLGEILVGRRLGWAAAELRIERFMQALLPHAGECLFGADPDSNLTTAPPDAVGFNVQATNDVTT